MKLARRICFGLVCFGLFAAGSLAAGEDPARKLHDTVEAALDAIYGEGCLETSREEKEARVREAVEARFSLRVIIRRAIGRNWEKMTADEQEQVVELIARLVVRTFVNNLNGNARPEVSFGETVTVTDKRIEVPSTVEADGQTYHVTYRMGRLASGWEIYDIVAEGISVVSNYRQQFDEHFRTQGGDALIARLNTLLENEEIGNDVKI